MTHLVDLIHKWHGVKAADEIAQLAHVSESVVRTTASKMGISLMVPTQAAASKAAYHVRVPQDERPEFAAAINAIMAKYGFTAQVEAIRFAVHKAAREVALYE